MKPLVSDEGHIKKLLGDRVKFKLYAAEQHLISLKEIEKTYGNISKDRARIEVEMEIDCFLSQLVGAVDSLLSQINYSLDLGIPRDRVNFVNVQSGLIAKTKKIDLLSALDMVRQQGKWYYILSELKNLSVHKSFLMKVVSLYDFSSPDPEKIRLVNVMRDFEESNNPIDQIMDREVIPYLERSLQLVSELIFSIRSSEPLLQK